MERSNNYDWEGHKWVCESRCYPDKPINVFAVQVTYTDDPPQTDSSFVQVFLTRDAMNAWITTFAKSDPNVRFLISDTDIDDWRLWFDKGGTADREGLHGKWRGIW